MYRHNFPDLLAIMLRMCSSCRKSVGRFFRRKRRTWLGIFKECMQIGHCQDDQTSNTSLWFVNMATSADLNLRTIGLPRGGCKTEVSLLILGYRDRPLSVPIEKGK